MEKYSELRTIAVVLRVVAFVVAGLAVLGAVGGLFTAPGWCKVTVFAARALKGAGGMLMLWTASEGIYLLLDVESHLRKIAEK